MPSSQLRPTRHHGVPRPINFQLAELQIPSGYLPDTGEPYRIPWHGSDSAGMSAIPISPEIAASTRTSSSTRFATSTQVASGRWRCEWIYSVLASIGDAGNSSTHTLNVEGLNYWNATPLMRTVLVCHEDRDGA